jgi:hypothetical protein
MGFDQGFKRPSKGGDDQLWFDFLDDAFQPSFFHVEMKKMMVLAKALFGKISSKSVVIGIELLV